jgi:predicted permease
MRATLESLGHDVRQAWRNTRVAPRQTLVLVLSLAFGLGSVVTMFSVCDGLLFRPPPFPGAERHYWAGRVSQEAAIEPRLDREEFRLLLAQSRTIEGAVGHCYMYMVLGGTGEPRYVSGAYLSANIFEFLGIKPALGRGFLPGEDEPGAPDVCVISHALWQRMFGGREDVIGRGIVLDDIPRTIVGVTPPDADFPRHFDLWLPLKFEQVRRLVSWSRGAAATVKLRPGVTRDQAAAELALIGARMQADNPGKYRHPWTLQLAEESRDEWRRRPEMLARYGSLFGVATLVLVIACVNVTNLLLVQAARRSHELAVRSALGASRGRLIRQMLVESLLLTSAGALLGLWLSAGLLDFLWASLATIDEPNWMRFRIDPRVLVATAGLVGVVSAAMGVLPAWRASRLDLTESLKDGSRSGSSLRLGRLSRWFVVLQVALSCAVLMAAAISLGSILLTRSSLLRFDPDPFFMMRVQVRDRAYPTVGDRARFFSRLLEELRAQPGVAEAVATSRQLDRPPEPEPIARGEDRATPIESRSRVLPVVCTPGYFHALGVPFLRGRDFTDADADGRPAVCIVNTALAARLFAHADPVGRTVRFEDRDWTIIGVVPDQQEQGLSAAPGPAGNACIYRPQAQAGFDFLSVLLKPQAGPPGAMLRAGAQALARVGPGVPIFEAMPWGEQIGQGLRFARFVYRLSLGFGVAAVLLAGVGVYSVVSFAAQQRRPEIGIRMALGAAPADIVRLVTREGIRQLGAGLLIGAAAACGVARWMATVIFPYPSGALKYGIVLILVLVISTAAVLFPAIRSSRLNPARIFHGES